MIRRRSGKLTFVPSHRRVPHVGSAVAMLTDKTLKFAAEAAARDGGTETPIGFLAFGEFIYGGDDERLDRADWMRTLEPEVPVTFAIDNLGRVARSSSRAPASASRT